MPLDTDLDAWITLTLVNGLGPRRLTRALQHFGAADAILAASARDLAAVDGMGMKTARQIRDQLDELSNNGELDQQKNLAENCGATIIPIHDESRYPRLLRLIPDPPPVLYVRGELREDDGLAVAIVGSRRCTQYGRSQADRLAALCSQSGLTIVSGGAYGIDASAHRAAMRVGGRTIAVLGSGLANPYPKDHVDLFDEIAAGKGAVVSELPMTAPPLGRNFPHRNRIISGMTLGTVVIEAAMRSGALITARLAAEDHGREVMALPGRVDSAVSAGCHKMLREGWATLVTNSADILDALGEAGQMLRAAMDDREPAETTEQPSLVEQNVTESQRALLDALKEPASLDDLCTKLAQPAAQLQSDLTMLEIRGAIRRRAGRFERAR